MDDVTRSALVRGKSISAARAQKLVDEIDSLRAQHDEWKRLAVEAIDCCEDLKAALMTARKWAALWKLAAKNERELTEASIAGSIAGVETALMMTQNERDVMRDALIRWHRANETPDFIAADEALAALAAQLDVARHEGRRAMLGRRKKVRG
jgi:hypothetical protein